MLLVAFVPGEQELERRVRLLAVGEQSAWLRSSLLAHSVDVWIARLLFVLVARMGPSGGFASAACRELVPEIETVACARQLTRPHCDGRITVGCCDRRALLASSTGPRTKRLRRERDLLRMTADFIGGHSFVGPVNEWLGNSAQSLDHPNDLSLDESGQAFEQIDIASCTKGPITHWYGRATARWRSVPRRPYRCARRALGPAGHTKGSSRRSGWDSLWW